jgi:hypothetical protein
MDADRYQHGEDSGDDDMLAVIRSIETTPNQEAELPTLDLRRSIGDSQTTNDPSTPRTYSGIDTNISNTFNTSNTSNTAGISAADEHVWNQSTSVAGSIVPPPPSAAQYVNIFDDEEESSADMSERLRAGSMSEDEEIAALVAMLDGPTAETPPEPMHTQAPGFTGESIDHLAERAVALVAERLVVVEHHDEGVLTPVATANRPDSSHLDQMQLDQALLDQALLDQTQFDQTQFDRAQPGAAVAWQSPPPPPPPAAPVQYETDAPTPPAMAISEPEPAVATPLYVAETAVVDLPISASPAPVFAPETEAIAEPQWASAIEPQHIEPQHIEPQHIEPQHIEPQHIEPQHIEPQAVAAPPAEPRHIEPQPMAPQHIEPEHIEPQRFEPQHVESLVADAQPVVAPAPITPAPVAPAPVAPAAAPAFDPVAPLRMLLAELDIAGASSSGGSSADAIAAQDLLDEMAYLVASAPADVEAERTRRWGAVVEARLVYKQLLEGASPQRMLTVTPAELAEAEILLRDLLDAEGKARRSMSGPKAFKKFGLARRRLDAYLENYGVESIDELRELALAGPSPVGPVTLADAGALVAAAEQAWQAVGEVEVGGLPQGIEADGFRLRCYRFIGSVVDDASLEAELRRRAEAPDEAGIIAGRLADAIRALGMPVGDDPVATARTLVGMLGGA